MPWLAALCKYCASYITSFETILLQRGGDSLNTVRNKLKKTEKQYLVAKDCQPEAKTNHVLPDTEDMETDQEVLGRLDNLI